jgi:hypothetical protein
MNASCTLSAFALKAICPVVCAAKVAVPPPEVTAAAMAVPPAVAAIWKVSGVRAVMK